MKNIKLKLLISIMAVSCFANANAATTTAPMQITATIDAKCNLTATNLTFGSIQLKSSSPSVTASINVECTKDTAYSISFNGGLNNSSGLYRLKHPTLNDYLGYMLFINDSGTFAPISPNQTALSGIGNGIGTQTATMISGTINTNANISPGNYSDTVTVTITY